jgi:hypothetical protein
LESPSDFNNEYISYDCGRGVAQITSNKYVGIGSNIRCYVDGKECLKYEYTGNIVDKELNIYKGDRLESYCHGSCCYYYKDEEGNCIREPSKNCDICENTNDENGNVDDCGKEWCRFKYGDLYCTDECNELEKCEKCECWRCKCRCNVNCKCKHYTNTTQGIYANIKDELRVLQEKYEWSKNKKLEARDITCDDSPVKITSEDFDKILAVWAYNGITTDINRPYLEHVADRLLKLSSYYGDSYKEELDNTISDEDLKIWACKLKWANDSRKILYAELKSPGELQIYDSQGRVTGLVNGEIKSDIPGSEYSDSTVTILFPSDSYRYEVIGIEQGTYGLDITFAGVGYETSFTTIDIPTSPNELHQYTIDWDTLSQDEEGVTVRVDSDGDGSFEDTFTTGGELTHDEFMLQTATTIDFDPDTLNLKSKGKWATMYIELPEGYDVSNIDISTVMLNKQVHAETHPTDIGDYDNDGVVDLMVKFDRSAVQEILEVGEEVEITVAGELIDGTPFEGSDNIRVIEKGGKK